MSLCKNINPSLVLVQPRKTRPYITERLLMGRKESNQTKLSLDTDSIGADYYARGIVNSFLLFVKGSVYRYGPVSVDSERPSISRL